MLVGASLDQLSAFSIEARLRFLTDKLISGAASYVDIEFTCDASVATGVRANSAAACDVPPSARATLLAELYELIGLTVEGVTLQSDGTCTVHVGRSSIVLKLSGDDLEDDDWMWRVESEVPVAHEIGQIKAVSCIPLGSDVQFIARSVD